MPPSDDTAHIDAGLGLLINLTGKMRMLSHRTAMFAMLIAGHDRPDPGHLERFDGAATEFGSIYRALCEGDAALGVTAAVAGALADTGAFGEDTKAPIERFLDLVHSLRQGLGAGSGVETAMARLVDLVAGDLLTTLNALTAAVSTTLNARIGARRAQNEQSRAAMLKAIGSINDVSLKVKLISLNASIEAARAGPYGKSFGVIAAEIRTLSEDAARSAKGLLEQMDRPA